MADRRTPTQQSQSDHDFLLSFEAKITTKMDYVIQGLDKLSDTVTKDVTNLKDTKLDKVEFERWQEKDLTPILDDREKRLRVLEKYGSIAIGGLTLANVILGIYLALRK